MSIPVGYTGPTQVASDGKRYPAHLIDQVNRGLAANGTETAGQADRPADRGSDAVKPQAAATRRQVKKQAPKAVKKKQTAKKAPAAKKSVSPKSATTKRAAAKKAPAKAAKKATKKR